jgi:hypothetical protein
MNIARLCKVISVLWFTTARDSRRESLKIKAGPSHRPETGSSPSLPMHWTLKAATDDTNEVFDTFTMSDNRLERTRRPEDVPLSSRPSSASNKHLSTDVFCTRATLNPAPPDTTTVPALLPDASPALVMLQLLKFDSMTKTTAAPDTATAPPRTAKLMILTPLAEQVEKLQDEMVTTESLEPGSSTANAPPLLLEGTPVAPLATRTELLLKWHSLTLMSDKAALVAYTAPPPPLAVPGRTDVESVNAVHLLKLDLEMITVRLDPLKFVERGAYSTPSLNSFTCGD